MNVENILHDIVSPIEHYYGYEECYVCHAMLQRRYLLHLNYFLHITHPTFKAFQKL